MKIDDAFMRIMNEIAYDELLRASGVDFKTVFSQDSTFNCALIIALVQAVTGSALINYHMRLEALLKQKGIDISDLEPGF